MSEHAAELARRGLAARSRTATPAHSRPAAWARRSAPCARPGRAACLQRVFVDETRPLLQGARLTAWELEADGIPHTVIADSAAGALMAAGEVDCVFVGADRIAANGDTANKIGTYPLAVLAARHEVPFYVVAPSSIVDLTLDSGAEIPIEERDPGEVNARFARLEPGVRRHAGRADPGDRDRARRPSRAVRGGARHGGACVKALILAAGYATRLYPLTLDRAEGAAPRRREADARPI